MHRPRHGLGQLHQHLLALFNGVILVLGQLVDQADLKGLLGVEQLAQQKAKFWEGE